MEKAIETRSYWVRKQNYKRIVRRNNIHIRSSSNKSYQNNEVPPKLKSKYTFNNDYLRNINHELKRVTNDSLVPDHHYRVSVYGRRIIPPIRLKF